MGLSPVWVRVPPPAPFLEFFKSILAQRAPFLLLTANHHVCRADANNSLSGLSLCCIKVPESDVEIVSTQVFCRSCGKAIENVPKRKPRQFCSDACRMKWWNAHPDEVKRKAYYTFTCPHCGRQFESYGNDHRKYCSRGCSAAGRRKGGAPDGC